MSTRIHRNPKIYCPMRFRSPPFRSDLRFLGTLGHVNNNLISCYAPVRMRLASLGPLPHTLLCVGVPTTRRLHFDQGGISLAREIKSTVSGI